MDYQTLYPAPVQQYSLRLLIARNLAFLEAFEAKDEHLKPQIDSSYLILRKLGLSLRLSYDDIGQLKRTLMLLHNMGIPIADNHQLLNELS